MDVYDKGEADDLSSKEKRIVSRIAKEIKDELIMQHLRKKGTSRGKP